MRSHSQQPIERYRLERQVNSETTVLPMVRGEVLVMSAPAITTVQGVDRPQTVKETYYSSHGREKLGCGHRPLGGRPGAREDEGRSDAAARRAFEDVRKARALEHLQRAGESDPSPGQREPYHGSDNYGRRYAAVSCVCFASPAPGDTSKKTLTFVHSLAFEIRRSHRHTPIDYASPGHVLNARSRAAARLCRLR